jgi:hypothetical protein
VQGNLAESFAGPTVTVEEEVLGRVVGLLERLAIPYMVTGSIAASYHGHPRATHDADVVIDPSLAQTEELLIALGCAGFYLNVEGARQAVRDRRQFNVIEMARATKVDLIVRKDRPFSVEEFSRRWWCDLPFASRVAIVTPEDAILSKLEWARMGGDSERQIRDAAGILEVNPTVDRLYIETWARELGVSDLWMRIATLE